MKSNITNPMLSFWEASHNDFPEMQKYIHPRHWRAQCINNKGRFVVQSTKPCNCNTNNVKYQRASNRNYIHFQSCSLILQTLKYTPKYLEDWSLRHEIQGQLILKIRGEKNN